LIYVGNRNVYASIIMKKQWGPELELERVAVMSKVCSTTILE